VTASRIFRDQQRAAIIIGGVTFDSPAIYRRPRRVVARIHHYRTGALSRVHSRIYEIGNAPACRRLVARASAINSASARVTREAAGWTEIKSRTVKKKARTRIGRE
jgi:hypothetical protein